MNSVQYQQYLQSDHWQHLRLKKLKTTTQCFFCRSKENPEIHHLRYRNIFDVTTKDLRRACSECHELYHAFEKEFPYRHGGPSLKFKWIVRQMRAWRRRRSQLEAKQKNDDTP